MDDWTAWGVLVVSVASFGLGAMFGSLRSEGLLFRQMGENAKMLMTLAQENARLNDELMKLKKGGAADG